MSICQIKIFFFYFFSNGFQAIRVLKPTLININYESILTYLGDTITTFLTWQSIWVKSSSERSYKVFE